MASQHAKHVMLRNSIKTLPMGFAKTPLSALKHHRFQGLISTSLRHTRGYQTSTGPPNGWGYTLFDCDSDLDIVDRISEEASDLGCEDLDLMFPKDQKHVVEMLNKDLLHTLFQRFLILDFRDRIVYLGALAMRLGVKIEEKDMQVLRESVGRVKMYDEAREQMRAALKGYNPAGGHPWEFSCEGPIDVEGEDFEAQASIFEEEFMKMMESIVEKWQGQIDASDTVRGQSAKTLLRNIRWAIKKS